MEKIVDSATRKTLTRRGVLRAGAAGAAFAGLGFPMPAVFAQPKAKQYRTALIGSGWWGKVITECAMRSGTVKMVAVCDADQEMVDSAIALVQEKAGDTPKGYRDYRELLEKEKPEICIVATPDHWHPLITIACVAAGAHVYVEKPIGHTILEGRAMVKAARAADRVVQVGLHRRVTPHGLSAKEFFDAGNVGEIGMVRAFLSSGGGVGSPASPDAEPPAGLDWDLWCGPAPYRPYNPDIHPRAWRQVLDFANGQVGDWVHWVDIVRWFIGDDQHPTYASAVGGIHIRNPESTYDAPDTMDIHWRFNDLAVTWEHRQYGGANHEKTPMGVHFFGTKGILHFGWRDGWTFYPAGGSGGIIHREAELREPSEQNIPELWTDFIESIETGRRPVCDIENGHRSTTMSLLGILSWKLGRGVQWDGTKDQCPGDAEANALLRRDYRAPWAYPEA